MLDLNEGKEYEFRVAGITSAGIGDYSLNTAPLTVCKKKGLIMFTVTSLGTYGALENESPRERFTLIFKQTSLNYCCCSEHSLLTPVSLFLYAFNGIVKKLQKGSTRWYYLIVVPHCSCKH